jgi:Family of unknown function (DUF6521)
MMVGKFFEARAKRGNGVNIVQVRTTRAILIQRWTGRPREEANLLNPAFCCTALTSSIVGYMGVDAEGMPYPLAFMILPIALHKTTREALPQNTRTSLAA